MRARSQHGSVEIIVQKAAFGLAVFFHMRRSAAHWRGAAGWRKVPDQAAWEVLRSAQRSHRTLKRLGHQTGTAAPRYCIHRSDSDRPPLDCNPRADYG
jgi:hypothetical protein